MLDDEVGDKSLNSSHKLKGMFEVEERSSSSNNATSCSSNSVSNVTLAFKSLSIKSKVKLQMLFKLIAAAKDSWAC